MPTKTEFTKLMEIANDPGSELIIGSLTYRCQMYPDLAHLLIRIHGTAEKAWQAHLQDIARFCGDPIDNN